jgi:drug/metabolite transporter (DMT)-like permease
MQKIKGHIAVLCANIIFGLNIPFTKALLDSWMTPLGIMSSRTLVAIIIFWACACFTPPEKVAFRDKLIILLGSMMGFVVSQFLTAKALVYTTPVFFSLICALCPVFVMLLAALFLREPITWKKVLGVALGVAGAFLLILNLRHGNSEGRNNMWGIALAFLSIFAWAIYLIIIRSVSQKYSVVTQMKWMFLFAAVVLLPLGGHEFPKQVIFHSAFDWHGAIELGFVLIFSTAIGYFLIPFGMKSLRATTVSVYMNLQPVVASAAAIWVGQDVFSWDKPIAAVLVIAGAWIVTMSPAKKEAPKESAGFKT